MAQNFDVVVLGAGPGGYVAAIRAAQLGFKVAVVEPWSDAQGKPSLGGTCLNVGCIPSKALLESSALWEAAHGHWQEHGVNTQGLELDLEAMQARKDKVVRQLTGGVSGLMRSNQISVFHGHGQLIQQGRVAFRGMDESTDELQAPHVIIATGSVPVELPSAPFDHELIVDSTGALSFDAVPQRLGIIGAGVIGLELGSVWRRLGAEVTIIEALPTFLPAADEQLAKAALKLYRSQGLTIHLGARLQTAQGQDGQVQITFQQEGTAQELSVDKLVVAVGRRPLTDGVLAADCGVMVNERGFIPVDRYGRTNVEGVYAIGDVAGPPLLAHKAMEEGVAVAEWIKGEGSGCNHRLMPSVIYTHPEFAWVGETEQALRERGVAVRTGVVPFAANGRALAMGESEGMVKIISEANTDTILGVHILGPFASELITEGVTAMAYGASSEDVARTIHAHPTLSETIHEAALACDKRAIHVRNR